MLMDSEIFMLAYLQLSNNKIETDLFLNLKIEEGEMAFETV